MVLPSYPGNIFHGQSRLRGLPISAVATPPCFSVFFQPPQLLNDFLPTVTVVQEPVESFLLASHQKKIKMTSLQSLRRSLLDRIWKEVTDSNFEQRLQQDDVVPSEVLSANGIIILGFDIEKADAPENSPHDSPILFKPAPRDFFQRNHIDLNGFESSRDRDHYYSLHKYRPSDGNEWLREEFWPKEFSRVVADYLEHWAFRDFPRKLEDSILPHLPDNFGIRKPS